MGTIAPASSRRLGLRFHLTAWVTYLALGMALTSDVWTTTSPGLLGSSGDSALHVWFQAWFLFAVGHGQMPLFSAAASYPHAVNLMWNNADTVLALVVWPLVLPLGWIRAENLLHVILLAFAAAMMAVQLRRHLTSAAAAWIGGLAFALYPFVQGQLVDGQITWLTIGTLPLGWWVLDHVRLALTTRAGHVRWGLAVGGWLVLQYMVNKELLATTVLVLVLIGAWPAYRNRRAVARAVASAAPLVAGASAVMASCLAVPIWVQFSQPSSWLHGAGLTPVGTYMDLLSWVLPAPGQLLGPGVVEPWTVPYSQWWADVSGYVGLPLLVFLAWAIWRLRRRRAVRWGAALIGVGALLASGEWLHVDGRVVGLPLPWWLLHHLPVYANAVPSRLTMFVALGVAIVVGFGADHLAQRRRSAPARLAVSVGVAALVVVPWFPAANLLQGSDTAPASLPSVFASARLRALPRGSVVVVAPIATFYNGSPMLWQALTGFRYRQPFGYILHPGPGGQVTNNPYPSPLADALMAYEAKQPVRLSRDLMAAMATSLDRWRARALIVTDPTAEPATVRLFARLVRRPPQVVGGSDLWLRPGPSWIGR